MINMSNCEIKFSNVDCIHKMFFEWVSDRVCGDSRKNYLCQLCRSDPDVFIKPAYRRGPPKSQPKKNNPKSQRTTANIAAGKAAFQPCWKNFTAVRIVNASAPSKHGSLSITQIL